MSRHQTLVPFVAAAVLFGISFVDTKAAIRLVPPVLFAAFCVDATAVALLTLIAVRGGYWLPRTRADVLDILASVAFILGANNVLLFLDQQHAMTSAAAAMYSIMSVASPVFAMLLLNGACISTVDTAGVLFGPIGVAVIVDPKSALGGGNAEQALIVCPAPSVTSGTMLLKRVEPFIGTLPQATWTTTTTAVDIHAASLGSGKSVAQVARPPELIAATLYVSVPATAATYLVYFASLSEVGPVRGNLVAYAISVATTVTDWAFFGEAVSPATILGLGVILSGFLLMQHESVARFVGLRGNVPAEAE